MSSAVERLEPRLALAITFTAVELVADTGDFAWVICIDDVVDENDEGRDVYMTSTTDGNPHFLVATNPEMRGATRLPRFTSAGRSSTVLVTSSNSWFDGVPGDDLPAWRGPTSGDVPHSFTFLPSVLIPDERLIVDLSPEGSRISIENEWDATLGDITGDSYGINMDWGDYQRYDGFPAVGDVNLYATHVAISADLSSSSRMTIGSDFRWQSGFANPLRSLTIEAGVEAVDFRVDLQGTGTAPGSLNINKDVSVSSALYAELTATNTSIQGDVTAANHQIFINPHNQSSGQVGTLPLLELAIPQTIFSNVLVTADDLDPVPHISWAAGATPGGGSETRVIQVAEVLDEDLLRVFGNPVGGLTLAAGPYAAGALSFHTIRTRLQIERTDGSAEMSILGVNSDESTSTQGLQIGDLLYGFPFDIGTTITSIDADSGTFTISAQLADSVDPATGAVDVGSSITEGSGGVLVYRPPSDTIAGPSTLDWIAPAITDMTSTDELTVGMYVTGGGVAANTRIDRILDSQRILLDTAPSVVGNTSALVFVDAFQATGVPTNGSNLIDFAPLPNTLAVGMYVFGADIPAGTRITDLDAANDQIEISTFATGGAGPQNLFFGFPDSFQQGYDLTTRSPATGVQTGQLTSTGSLVVTLANPGGGDFDVKTSVDRFGYTTGFAADGTPYRYDITIDEASGLIIDSVGQTSGDISVSTNGGLTITGNAVRSVGDVRLASAAALSLAGSVTSSAGDVYLEAAGLTVNSTVSAGGANDVRLVSSSGATSVDSVARAGGMVKQTVRVASTKNVDIGTAPTEIDAVPGTPGTPLNNGDRILLKNQTNRRENGLYVFNGPNNALTRAPDADRANEFDPGFVVFVREGTQEGGWSFKNSTLPTFNFNNVNQTRLNFQPVSATRVYDEVEVATTGNITLSGTQTIDGQILAVGERVLVKDQSNQALNGLYSVADGAWRRVADADAANELIGGGYVFVKRGTANAGKAFFLTADAVQVGTSPLVFHEFRADIAPPPGVSSWSAWAPSSVLADVVVSTTRNIELAGVQTVDGVLLSAGNRVLVKNQTDATKNGIYEVVAGGQWNRTGDADTSQKMPRGSTVYVSQGTQSAGTLWRFDDSVRHAANTERNSAFVSGLASTAGLAAGMLVTGEGIGSNSTIAQIVNSTTIRLSKVAVADGSLSPLTFRNTPDTQFILGTDGVSFAPAGGTISVAAATSIGGGSRLQASSGLFNAGTLVGAGQATSAINLFTNMGRVSAAAPGSISLSNSNALELASINTSTAGGITASADGTLTVRSIATAGSPTVSGDITLTSVYGDLVAGVVTSQRGAINLKSVLYDVVLGASSDISTTGSVLLAADSGKILASGNIRALGDAGAIAFSSVNGDIEINATASIVSEDLLRLFVPSGTITVNGSPEIAAGRLEWTGKGALPAGIGSYNTVNLTRTDPGDLVVDLSGTGGLLTVQGINTLDGDIDLKAAGIRVEGLVITGGVGQDAKLEATAGDIVIDADIRATKDVVLTATAGSVTRTEANIATATATLGTGANSGKITSLSVGVQGTGYTSIPLVTVAPPDAIGGTQAEFTALLGTGPNEGQIVGFLPVSFGSGYLTAPVVTVAPPAAVRATERVGVKALSKALVRTVTAKFDAELTGPAPELVLTEEDGLSLTSVKSPNGGSITVSVGSPSNGGALTVGEIDAPGATISLAAAGNVVDDADAGIDVIGSQLAVRSITGKIDLDTKIDVLDAFIPQSGQTVTITDASVTGLELRLLEASEGDIDVTSTGTMTVSTLSTKGTVTLKATAADADILIDSLSVLDEAVTLEAARSIGHVDPALVSLLSSPSAKLKAGTGTIDLTVAVDEIEAEADDDITISDADGFTANAIKSTGGNIQLNVGRVSTGTGAVQATTGALIIVATESDVSLTNALNNVKTLNVNNPGRGVAFTDADGLEVAAIEGKAIVLSVGGDLTQTGEILGESLKVIASNGAVTLTSPLNDVAAVAIENLGRDATYVDATAVDIGVDGLKANAIKLTAGGAITQTGVIEGTSLIVESSVGGAITLNGVNKLDSFKATSLGGAVSFTDTDGNLGIDGILAASAAITAKDQVTQTAVIEVTGGLSVTSTNAGAITLQLANKAASFAATSSDTIVRGDVKFTDSDAGLVLGVIDARDVTISTPNAVTQSGVIKAATLDVTSTLGKAITLDTQSNEVGGFKAMSENVDDRGAVSFTDSAGDLEIKGLTAASATIRATEAVTQSGVITLTGLLDVSSSAGKAITLNTQANTVASFKAVTTDGGAPATVGDISFKDTAGVLDLAGITGKTVSIEVADGVTQSAAITAETSLAVTAVQPGPITLTNVNNDIELFSATGVSKDISLVSANAIKIGPITTGQAATANDGNIMIEALQGNISVVGDLTAEKDSITLSAKNGTIVFQLDGVTNTYPTITAEVLAYYFDALANRNPLATDPPAQPPVDGVAPDIAVPSILVANGDLDINRPNENFQFSGYAATGNVTINVGGLILTGELSTSGIGKTITIITTGNGNTTGDVELRNTAFIRGETISINAVDEMKLTSPATNLLLVGTTANVQVGAGSLNLPVALTTITAAAPGDVTLADADALRIAGLTGTALKVTVGGDLTQSGAMFGTSLEASSTGGVITLANAGNDVDTLKVSNPGRNVSFTDVDGLGVTAIEGAAIALSVGGDLTQTGAIKGSSLAVTASAGTVTLTHADNELASVSVSNPGGDISLRDKDGIAITSLLGSAMTVQAGGQVTQTQTGTVVGDSLDVSTTLGDIVLPNSGNDVGSFEASNATRGVSFRDANDVKVGPIAAEAVVLNVGGISQQTGTIEAPTLTVTGSSDAIVLDDPTNKVGTLSITNPGHDVTFVDNDGVIIASLVGDDIDLEAGPITQTGAITASKLTVTGSNGAVLLDDPNNDVGGLSITNGNRSITFVDKTGVDIISLSGGALALQVVGDLKQSGAITGISLSVTASAGEVTLTDAANDVDSVSIVNTGRGISFRDLDDLMITALTGSALNVEVGSTLGQTVTGVITGSTLSVTASGGTVTLNNSANDVDVLTVANANGVVTVTDKDDLQLGSFIAGATTLTVGGTLGQTTPLTATGLLTVRSSAGAISLGLSNNLVSVDLVGIGAVSVGDSNALEITKLQGTTLSVTTFGSGDVTQTAGGSIIGDSFELTVADGTAIFNGANDINYLDAEIIGAAAGRTLTFNDIDDLDITQINQGGAITLSVGGDLTQTGTVTGDSLSVMSTAGVVTLGLNNDVESVAITTANGAVTFTDIDGLEIATLGGNPGVNAGTAAINLKAGSFTQSADIKGGALTVTGTAGAVDLGRTTNDVNSVSITNGSRAVSFGDADDVTVMGIAGGAITLIAGTINQTGATGIISGTTLEVTGTVGPISLDRQNTVTSFKASNVSRPITFTDADALELTGVTGGAITVTVGGNLTQTAPVQGNSLTVNSSAGNVVLEDAANSVATLAVTNGSRGVKYKNAGNLTAVSVVGGAVELTAAAISDADGSVDISATSAKLEATIGAISLGLDVGTATATAPGNINLTNAKALGLTATSSGGSVTASAAGTLTATSVSATAGNVGLTATGATSDIAVGVITANATTGTATLTAGRSITDGDAATDVTANAAVLTATAGSIDLDLAVNSATATAAGNIDLSNTKALGLTAASSAGNVVATAAGTLTATNVAATAGNVNLSATGATSDIAAGVIAANATTGTATLVAGRSITDGDAATDVTANAAALTASAGSIDVDLAVNSVTATAAGGIDVANSKALGLTATSTTGSVVASAVGTLTATSVSASAGSVNLTATGAVSDIAVGVITASPSTGTTTLTAGRSITDGDSTLDLTANAASLTATAGSIDLDLAVNTVTKAQANGNIDLSNNKPLGLTATSTAGNIVATAAGMLTATNVSAVAGNVGLTATAAGNIAVGVIAASSTAGTATLLAAGSITDGDAATDLTAKAATLTATAGTIDIDTSVDTLTATAAGNIDVSNTKALGLTATSTTGKLTASSVGDMTIGQATIPGVVTLSTSSAGDLYVSSVTNGVLSSQSQVDLQGIAGQVYLINNGRILAPSAVLRDGQSINVGEPVTTSVGLTDAINQVNNATFLPNLGVPYQITVEANVSLSAPLTITRPVDLRGVPAGSALAGQISGSGLTLSSGASGSRISDLTFSNFSGTALRLNSVKNAQIHGNTFLNSGVGLLVTGASDGTTVRNNLFRNIGTGISLNDATSLTVGGTQAGQPNRIESAARVGFFATGENQFSEVIYTQFANNALNYNYNGARGLTVIDGVAPTTTAIASDTAGVQLARDVSTNGLFVNGVAVKDTLGRAVRSNSYAGWTPLAAETIGGVNYILWRNDATKLAHRWQLDSNWRQQSVVSITNGTAGYFAAETAFEVDANGDGETGQPTVPLSTDSGSVILQVSPTTNVMSVGTSIVKDTLGRDVRSNSYAGWTPLAAETIGGVNYILWRNDATKLAHRWQLDSHWRQQSNVFIANGTAGYFAAETAFNVDANGDGATGQPSVPLSTDSGSVILHVNRTTNVMSVGSSTVKDTLGRDVRSNSYAGWTPLAAETIGGVNYILWRNDATKLATRWQLDSNWRQQSNVFIANGTAGYFAAETAFNVDANGDGNVGS